MTVYVLKPRRTGTFCNQWIQAICGWGYVEAEFVRWCGRKSRVTPYGKQLVPSRYYGIEDLPVPVVVAGRPFILVDSWGRFRAMSHNTTARSYLCPAAPLVPRTV